MIDNIKITNFQSHKDTRLELCPGVNVLTGTSDSGKSAVVRALVWLAQNRPQGAAYRSTWVEPGDVTGVEVGLSGGAGVVRERDGQRVNRYRLNGDLELEALRADVPAEVREALVLEEYNVQGQHDAYFLLQNTPGEVARMLNDVVGLDVIDAVLREVNSIVLDSARGAGAAKAEAERLEAQVAEYAFLDAVEKHVARLDALTRERDERRAEAAALTNLARDLELADREVRQAEAWLAVDGELSALEKEAGEFRRLKLERDDLARLADELEDVAYRLDRHEALAALTEQAREAHELFEERRKLAEVVGELELAMKREADCMVALTAYADEERGLLGRVTECPVCGTAPLDGRKRERVIGYFQGRQG